jgi:hypothetical protein
MKLFSVALFRIFATSIISVMNVDWFFAMISQLPTRAKIQSINPILALCAGTNNQQCANNIMIADCLR